jgi:glutaredoxin 3
MNIEIYTRPGCGYCTNAKRLLDSKSLSYTEYDVYALPEHLAKLQKRTDARTYPQVFIDNESIGGFTELLAHDKAGNFNQ